MDGFKTYITVGVTVLFSVLTLLKIDLGLSPVQVEAAFTTLIALVLGFMRHGVAKVANGK